MCCVHLPQWQVRVANAKFKFAQIQFRFNSFGIYQFHSVDVLIERTFKLPSFVRTMIARASGWTMDTDTLTHAMLVKMNVVKMNSHRYGCRVRVCAYAGTPVLVCVRLSCAQQAHLVLGLLPCRYRCFASFFFVSHTVSSLWSFPRRVCMK